MLNQVQHDISENIALYILILAAKGIFFKKRIKATESIGGLCGHLGIT